MIESLTSHFFLPVTFEPLTENDHAFLSDEIAWPPQLGSLPSAFVYKMDCLDSHESILFFSAASSESSLPAVAIFHYAPLYIPLFSRGCLFWLQAVPSCISPVSQSALPPGMTHYDHCTTSA